MQIYFTLFQYISNKMQLYTVYFIWKLLYMFRVVPSPIIRRGNNYLQHHVFFTPLLLSAVIVEELELVSVCCGWRTPDGG
jgi:hypothetical protein